MAAVATAGHRIEVRSPREGEAIKLGRELAVECDIEVADPWFPWPSYGREVGNIDGRTRHTLAFEAKGGAEVEAPFSGNASITDTGIDNHAPSSLGDKGGARTGYSVTLRSGSLEMTFGHLQRGSGRSGSVKAGDAIGRAGNTGRCADGCGKCFVSVDLTGGRIARDLRTLTTPIEVEASLDGKALGKAVTLPAGELRAKNLKVARLRVTKERFHLKEENPIRIVLRRGRKVLVETSVVIKVSI